MDTEQTDGLINIILYLLIELPLTLLALAFNLVVAIILMVTGLVLSLLGCLGPILIIGIILLFFLVL